MGRLLLFVLYRVFHWRPPGSGRSQVFPEDYDGIMAGSPGHNRTHLHMTFVNDYKVSHTAPGDDHSG